MHRGKVHTVTTEKLGCPPTKEASYLAANEWWRGRLADLTRHPHHDRINELSRSKVVAERLGERDEAERLAQQITQVERTPEWDDPEPEWPADRIAMARVLGITVPDDLNPHAAHMIFGDGRVWAERFKRADPNASNNAADTIEALSRQWNEMETGRCRTGQMKPRTLSNNRVNVEHFVGFIGGPMVPTAINEATIERYYGGLLQRVGAGELSASNARARMGTAIRFVRWLWEQRKLELPRNLDREWRFGGHAPVIVVFTKEEIRQLLAAATGQNRLHVLLMLNCGFYPTDIAALRDDEVDWERGIIHRKRTKTRTHGTVPTVSYPLWSDTFRLLKEHRSGSGIVLLNERKREWIRSSVGDDGKVKFTDVISVSLDALLKRAGTTKPVKSLRKTGATLLESHADFARFVGLYLGHAPRTMAEKHYADPDRAGFDRAVGWLGEQLGIALRPKTDNRGQEGV